MPDGPKYIKSFKSHVNKKYSMFSSIALFQNGNTIGSYFVSGSEDNKVRLFWLFFAYFLYVCLSIYVYFCVSPCQYVCDVLYSCPDV